MELPLKEIFEVMKPLDADLEARFKIFGDVRAVVGSITSLRGATVEPHGSFISNLSSRWGDLDLSIDISHGSDILIPGRNHQQTLLEDVLEVLRKRGGWRRFFFITNARVPILKCERSFPDISCKISINNLSAQMKSKILFWFHRVDERFREIVLLVKEWAKAHGINDSNTGSLNSYSLTLLVIFHFQTCTPAIFPPLSFFYPGNMAESLKGNKSVAKRRIEETCSANIIKFNSWKRRNPRPLNMLFYSFLAKFSDISSRSETQGICLYTGQWECIDSNPKWQPKTYTLFVEDPFERSVNTTRSVTRRGLEKISKAFQMTLYKLSASNQIQGPVIPFLVTPQIAQLLPRMMVDDPSLGYIGKAHPQKNWPNSGALESNYQTQNGKTDQVDKRFPSTANTQRPAKSDRQAPSKPNTSRPVLFSQQQEQRVWRPTSDVPLSKTNTQRPAQFDRGSPSMAISQRPQVSQKQEQQVWRPRSDVPISKANTQRPAQFDRGFPSMAIAPRPVQISQKQEQQVWMPRSDVPLSKASTQSAAQSDRGAPTKAIAPRPGQVSPKQEQQVLMPISNVPLSKANTQSPAEFDRGAPTKAIAPRPGHVSWKQEQQVLMPISNVPLSKDNTQTPDQFDRGGSSGYSARRGASKFVTQILL